ncbi:MAG: site-specific integrase [Patescibacteria group bacterium]
MAVRKPKNKNWQVDFQINGIRYRERSPLNTKAGAEAYEAVLRQRLSRGEDIKALSKPSEQTTFKAFTKEWMETCVRHTNKPSEIRAKVTILKKHLVPFFGELPLEKITSQAIETFKALKIKQKLSAKTVNNILTVLHRCLRVACEWERLERMPKILKIKTISQRIDFLSPAESSALLRHCTEVMWKEMILVAVRTGMRLGELFGLEWQDVDFERKQLTVRRSIVRGNIGTPKSGKVRYIPLTDEVCKAIYERRQRSGLLFHRGDESCLTHHIADDAIKRACKAADIRPIGFHTLRHTFASQLVSEGVPLNAVQELMGHSTIAMTMKYAHLAPSALRSAVEVLAKAEQRETATECLPSVYLENVLAQLNV